MKIQPYYHEDDRRIMAEYIIDYPIRTCKAIFMKEGAVLGNHYHKLAEDIFFLMKGAGTYTLNGKEKVFKEGQCIKVKKGVVHSLNLTKGSILLEASTLPYDKEDEYTV